MCGLGGAGVPSLWRNSGDLFCSQFNEQGSTLVIGLQAKRPSWSLLSTNFYMAERSLPSLKKLAKLKVFAEDNLVVQEGRNV